MCLEENSKSLLKPAQVHVPTYNTKMPDFHFLKYPMCFTGDSQEVKTENNETENGEKAEDAVTEGKTTEEGEITEEGKIAEEGEITEEGETVAEAPEDSEVTDQPDDQTTE